MERSGTKNIKCGGKNMILCGQVHLVSCFPLHFMLYRGNFDYFSDSVQRMREIELVIPKCWRGLPNTVINKYVYRTILSVFT